MSHHRHPAGAAAFGASLALIALAATPVRAQDAEPPPPKPPVAPAEPAPPAPPEPDALPFEELARRLAAGGEQWLGLYLDERRFGHVRFEAKAQEGGGAVVSIETRMAFGPAEQQLDETLTVGAGLDLVRYDKKELQRKPGAESSVTLEMTTGATAGELAWKQATRHGDAEPAATSGATKVARGALSAEMASFAIALLDWGEGKSYRMPILGSPDDPEGGTQDAIARFEKVEKIDHHGEAVEAIVVRFEPPGGDAAFHYVAGGRLLKLVPAGETPVRMVGGTRDQILGADEEEPADAKAARAAAVAAMRAMNVGDADALRATIDFAAVHAAMKAANPDRETATAAELEKAVIDDFVRQAKGLDDAARADRVTQAEAAGALARVRVDGEKATVKLPGGADAQTMELTRDAEGKWRVTGGTLFTDAR